jgi:hypothetical protein
MAIDKDFYPNYDYIQGLKRSTGTSNYPLVDENKASEDTSDFVYNDFDTSNFIQDLYGFPDHTAENGTINSVTLFARAVCSAGGPGATTPAAIKLAIKIGDIIFFNNAGTSLSITDTTYSWAMTVKPSDSSAWTWSDIDAILAGPGLRLGVYSGKGNHYYTAYCYQFYMTVNYTDSTGAFKTRTYIII